MMIFSKFSYAINVLSFRDTRCLMKIAIADSTDDRSYKSQMCPIDLHNVLAMTEDDDDNFMLRLMSIDYDKSAATQLVSFPLICQQKCGNGSVLISFSSIFCSRIAPCRWPYFHNGNMRIDGDLTATRTCCGFYLVRLVANRLQPWKRIDNIQDIPYSVFDYWILNSGQIYITNNEFDHNSTVLVEKPDLRSENF